MATTSSTNSVALDRISTRHYPLMTFRGILSLVAALALLAFSWQFAEIRPGVLVRPATAAAIWNFVRQLFPPDLSPEFLRTVLRAVAQTTATAVVGTLLSLVVALPL
jgi:phosphonate transport system permease protein